jgi:hypothetical protein
MGKRRILEIGSPIVSQVKISRERGDVRGTPFDLLSSLYPYIYSSLSLQLPYYSSLLSVVEVASVVTVTIMATVT